MNDENNTEKEIYKPYGEIPENSSSVYSTTKKWKLDSHSVNKDIVEFKLRYFDEMARRRQKEIEKNLRETGTTMSADTIKYWSNKQVKRRRNKRIRKIIIGRTLHRIGIKWLKLKQLMSRLKMILFRH